MTFNWLPLSDRKTLPSVRVLYVDITEAAGYFVSRTEHRCFNEEFQIERSERDVIVLSTHWGDPTGTTVAHEHRHFQQRYGLSPVRLGRPLELEPRGETYEDWAQWMRRFYSQPWEKDALLYSLKHDRDDATQQQYEALL